MSELDLDAVEARAGRASPAPWHYGTVGSVAGGTLYDATREIATLTYEQADDHDGRIVRHLLSDEADRNGKFIAHARDDVPALVAEVRRLREWRRRLLDEGYGFEDTEESAAEVLEWALTWRLDRT